MLYLVGKFVEKSKTDLVGNWVLIGEIYKSERKFCLTVFHKINEKRLKKSKTFHRAAKLSFYSPYPL